MHHAGHNACMLLCYRGDLLAVMFCCSHCSFSTKSNVLFFDCYRLGNAMPFVFSRRTIKNEKEGTSEIALNREMTRVH